MAVTSVMRPSPLAVISRGFSGSALAPSAGALTASWSAASYALADSGWPSVSVQAEATTVTVTARRVQLRTVRMRGVSFMDSP